MKAWGVLALLLWPRLSRAEGADAAVSSVFAQIEAIEAQSSGAAVDERERQRQIARLEPDILRWKEKAVPPLATVALDPERALKVRAWAASFLARTHDVAALSPLKRLLLDPKEAPVLRSAAAADLPQLAAPPEDLARAYCAALEDKELPPGAFHPAILSLSDLGCDEAKALEWWAKRRGPDPRGEDLRDVEKVLSALACSKPLEATRALFRLFDYFRRGTYPRRQILERLSGREYQLSALGGEAAKSLRKALAAEAENPPAALAALRLVGDLKDDGSVPVLLKLLANPDAEVVVVSAEVLAALKAREALSPLQKLYDGIGRDPRFGEAKRPVELSSRVEAALKALKAR